MAAFDCNQMYYQLKSTDLGAANGLFDLMENHDAGWWCV
jgi:hypothetical protein